MIKNGIIALLISSLVMTVDAYAKVTGPVMFVCMVAVLFVCISAIECECDRIKGRMYTARRLRKQIKGIKITPPPTKA